MLPKRMSSSQSLAPGSRLPEEIEKPAPKEFATEPALLSPASQGERDNPSPLTGPVVRLPVELDVAVPVREFRVRNLLALEAGQVIETQWTHGEDIPLASGAVQLAWSEFEVVDAQLAVRITRLA